MTATCRAALWYDKNMLIEDCSLGGIIMDGPERPCPGPVNSGPGRMILEMVDAYGYPHGGVR